MHEVFKEPYWPACKLVRYLVIIMEVDKETEKELEQSSRGLTQMVETLRTMLSLASHYSSL